MGRTERKHGPEGNTRAVFKWRMKPNQPLCPQSPPSHTQKQAFIYCLEQIVNSSLSSLKHADTQHTTFTLTQHLNCCEEARKWRSLPSTGFGNSDHDLSHFETRHGVTADSGRAIIAGRARSMRQPHVDWGREYHH